MKLITWNVQWCCGMDGRVDPARIVRTAREIADFDVLCVQELARNFATLPGSHGEDQFALLRERLPGYTAFFVASSDLDDGAGGRRQFGNAIFSRRPVAQVHRHLLPWPVDAAVPSMQRAALEVTMADGDGWMRLLTTHLEYHSALQRVAQVHALRGLLAEAAAHAIAPQAPSSKPDGAFPPLPRPLSTVLCGDFNFQPGSTEHGLMMRPLASPAPALLDAWTLSHPGEPHPFTFRIFDPDWTSSCCDFVFISADLASRVVTVAVEPVSQASDHQAVLLELSDRAPALCREA